jgi:hypothetical protein
MQCRLQMWPHLHAVGELAAKLEHIMKSEYFTIQPQVQQMQQVCRETLKAAKRASWPHAERHTWLQDGQQISSFK